MLALGVLRVQTTALQAGWTERKASRLCQHWLRAGRAQDHRAKARQAWPEVEIRVPMRARRDVCLAPILLTGSNVAACGHRPLLPAQLSVLESMKALTDQEGAWRAWPGQGRRTATEGLLLPRRFFACCSRARATTRSTARQARHDSGALHCLVNASARMRAGCMLDMQGSRWSLYPECSRRCERSRLSFAPSSHRLRSLQVSMLPSYGGNDAVKSSQVAPSSAHDIEMLRALAAPEAGSSETRLGRRNLALSGTCRQLSVEFDESRAEPGSLQAQSAGP